MEYLFLLGRVLLGGYFIMSGLKHFMHLENMTGYAKSKGVPMAREGVMASGLMMLLGGLGVLLGIYVSYAIYLLVVFLFVAAFKMHQFWTIAEPMSRMGERINFEKNLALAGALLMLLSLPVPWLMSLM